MFGNNGYTVQDLTYHIYNFVLYICEVKMKQFKETNLYPRLSTGSQMKPKSSNLAPFGLELNFLALCDI